ncbi:MAG: kynureninase [Acidimicrobiia bacterium]|nr:kynureninase [Acidimicrobiia bacterium]
MITRPQAKALDAADPLAGFRDLFVISEPDLLYLDGNSLGRLPKATVARVREAVDDDWGRGLVRSWQAGWMQRPREVGDRLAPLIGAGPGEVLLADQTSLNLFKLATAALDAAAPRSTIVSDAGNFPSDLYVLAGVAERAGGSLVTVDGPESFSAALDPSVGLLSASHVNFKSGKLADMAGLTGRAHDAGAMVLWDLSHSVGAVPIDVNGAGVDLAIGCTYKYLNGGPGAPAFLYVARHLQDQLTQPIHGWWGQQDMFGFDLGYQPAAGIDRFAVGTMPMLSLIAAESGIEISAEAGIGVIREKGMALTALMVDLFDELPGDLGFSLASPRDAEDRGSHISLSHPDGYRITQALIERGVIPDFRAPDIVRLGAAPLYTRYVDVWDAFDRLRQIMESGEHLAFTEQRSGVT